ncbi:hypothetical protein GKE82_24260 [Conexibacter sp. W3-3-2]|uniref:hypothetical protein n=1 Tax=Conexibacter sp. W3-3-2 TaxID=2675227 RepID=UPI0012BA0507|nr:hypothetical protein [Conexibacter sp. W3-3-2]MTD47323.1 hypothetical protein [Conexibacter sp. W3-3-2]
MMDWTDLFSPEHVERAAARDRPLLLTCPPGAADLALLTLARPGPALTLDARLSASSDALLVDLVRGTLTQIAPASQFHTGVSTVHRDDALAIATAYGNPDVAIASAMGAPHADLTLDKALSAVPDGTELRILHADLLDPDILWAIRGHAQDGRPTVLTSRPWAAPALLKRDAAMFGTAQHLELPAAITPAQARAAGRTDAEIDWMLARTRAARAPYAELARLAASTADLDTAWNAARDRRAASTGSALTIARQLAPWGARLLLAIAAGARPYPAVPNVTPPRVAGALRALQRADLIYQPAARQWALADPFLAAALTENPPPR